MSTASSRPRPVLIVFSVLAGAQVLTGGAALGDFLGAKLAGLIVLVIAAVQTGMTFYIQGQVTPNSQVAALVDEFGGTVAGEAAHQANGEPVTVS